jgi:hypothetical protein
MCHGVPTLVRYIFVMYEIVSSIKTYVTERDPEHLKTYQKVLIIVIKLWCKLGLDGNSYLIIQNSQPPL